MEIIMSRKPVPLNVLIFNFIMEIIMSRKPVPLNVLIFNFIMEIIMLQKCKYSKWYGW